MTGKRNRKRLGDMLAVIVAMLLAGIIVALAATSEDPAMDGSPSRPVTIELDPQSPPHGPVLPGPIAQDGSAEDALNRLAAEQRCLADVIYFEARGESEAGRRAVAEVILHRLAQRSHGRTICDVVYEGTGQTFCQFTFACDGSTLRPRAPGSWRAAEVLAARLLAGEVPTDATQGATYYHSLSVHPSWAPEKLRLVQIGNHVFYRDRMAEISLVIRGFLP